MIEWRWRDTVSEYTLIYIIRVVQLFPSLFPSHSFVPELLYRVHSFPLIPFDVLFSQLTLGASRSFATLPFTRSPFARRAQGAMFPRISCDRRVSKRPDGTAVALFFFREPSRRRIASSGAINAVRLLAWIGRPGRPVLPFTAHVRFATRRSRGVLKHTWYTRNAIALFRCTVCRIRCSL